MRLLTVFLLFILLPSLGMAAGFTPPPTDKSVDLLGVIFGTHVGPVYLGGPPNPALKHMFELFNAVIISIGTVIVSYIGIVSTINTAQEGKAMGKKWNSIWIPMRATMGMALIIPTPGSGYSIVQSTIMWLILQGIGAADYIWTGILTDLSSGISVIGEIRERNAEERGLHTEASVYDDLLENGQLLTDEILRSAVCMVVLQNISNGTATNDFNFKAPSTSVAARYGRSVQWYNIADATSVLNEDVASYSGTAYIGVPGNERYYDVCGSYKVSATVRRDEWDVVDRDRITQNDLSNQASQLYNLKLDSMSKMFNNAYDLAREIAAEGERLKPRHGDTGRLISPIDGDIVQPAGYRQLLITTYFNEMQTAIKPHQDEGLRDVIRKGVLNGWITAGSFFFVLNQTSEVDYFESVTDLPRSKNIPRCDNNAHCSNVLPTGSTALNPKLISFLEYHEEQAFLASRLWDAKIYLENDQTSVAREANIVQNEDAINSIQHQTAVLIRDMMTEQHRDPIIAQGKFGSSLMIASERSWINLLAEQESEVDRLAEEGRPLNAAEMARREGLNTHTALALSLYGITWAIGVMLAIYIPLIPYLMFTVAVVGWFLLVIEAIVAAPILALSFILPSGEELGKVMQGMMLILNIILRPTLMLFGFILATRLYQAVVQLVNFSIVGNLDSLDTGESLFAWLAIITIYGAFTVSLANKCFSLIYALPDKILRWMGGGAEHTDVSQEMHAVKGGIGKGEELGKQISSGFAERELARLDAQAKQIGNPPDAVRGGGGKGKGT